MDGKEICSLVFVEILLMYFKIYFFINYLFCLFIIFIFVGMFMFFKFIINIKKKIRYLCVEIVLFLFFMCNFFFNIMNDYFRMKL